MYKITPPVWTSGLSVSFTTLLSVAVFVYSSFAWLFICSPIAANNFPFSSLANVVLNVTFILFPALFFILSDAWIELSKSINVNINVPDFVLSWTPVGFSV